MFLSVCLQVLMKKLSLIDLAGSEHAKLTAYYREQVTQGAGINHSLLALGSCSVHGSGS